MGLLDILNSIQNAPSGEPQPAGGAQPASGGGMSPIMLALLGLLAYKALQSGALGNILGGGQPAPAGVPAVRRPPLPAAPRGTVGLLTSWAGCSAAVRPRPPGVPAVRRPPVAVALPTSWVGCSAARPAAAAPAAPAAPGPGVAQAILSRAD